MFRLVWQELVFRRNAIIGWAVGLCFFPLVYIAIYPSVADEMAGLADLEIYQAMGVNLGNFADWIGSIIVVFLPLVAAIYALVNGTGTLAGEEEDGRLEMLVTLPLPRWQIVTAKAVALSVSAFVILSFVSLVSLLVFQAIEPQLETTVMAADIVVSVLSGWPLVFAVGMIGMFLAAFCPTRRLAAMITTTYLIISYFGSNLASSTTALEPFEPFFLYTYLDSTGEAVMAGQQLSDMAVLLGIGLAAFGLALFFFQRRDLTVGAWPWQQTRASVAQP